MITLRHLIHVAAGALLLAQTYSHAMLSDSADSKVNLTDSVDSKVNSDTSDTNSDAEALEGVAQSQQVTQACVLWIKANPKNLEPSETEIAEIAAKSRVNEQAIKDWFLKMQTRAAAETKRIPLGCLESKEVACAGLSTSSGSGLAMKEIQDFIPLFAVFLSNSDLAPFLRLSKRVTNSINRLQELLKKNREDFLRNGWVDVPAIDGSKLNSPFCTLFVGVKLVHPTSVAPCLRDPRIQKMKQIELFFPSASPAHVSTRDWSPLRQFESLQGLTFDCPVLVYQTFLSNLRPILYDFRQLTHLSFKNSHLEIGDFRELSAILGSLQLKSLDLSNTNLGSRIYQSHDGRGPGPKYDLFAALLSSSPTLQVLNLARNRLGDYLEISVLTESLSGLDSLQSLNLEGNQFSDSAVAAVARVLHGKVHLKELNIKHNNVSLQGLKDVKWILCGRENLALQGTRDSAVSQESFQLADAVISKVGTALIASLFYYWNF